MVLEVRIEVTLEGSQRLGRSMRGPLECRNLLSLDMGAGYMDIFSLLKSTDYIFVIGTLLHMYSILQ